MADPHPTIVAGWREWVTLPDAGVEWIKAKLDTGARSSSLHAFDVEEVERDGRAWVRFSRASVAALRARTPSQLECPVHDRRLVRSSSGHAEERIVVLMDLRLLGRTGRPPRSP